MVLRRRLESLPVELGEQETRYSVLEAEAEKHLVERKRALSWAQSLENDVRDWEARVEKLEQQIRILRDAGAAQVARHEAEQHRGEIAKAEEKAKKKPDPAKMFEKKDADGDGALTLDEFKKGMKDKQLEGAEKRFKRLDADGDGKITLEEMKAGLAKMGQKKK